MPFFRKTEGVTHTVWKLIPCLLVFCAMGFGAQAQPPSAQEQSAARIGLVAGGGEPVRIGAIQPLTGELQAFGQTSLSAIQLAIRHMNDEGGLPGQRRAELVVGDSQTLPQAGVEAARRLVSIEKVVGLIGGLASGVTIPVASSVTVPNHVPQISGASTSPRITTLEDNGFLFRTIPNDSLQGVALADLVMGRGLTRVGVIYVNNDYGKGLADAFVEAYEARGGRITQNVAYAPRSSSYRSELRAAARQAAEALVLIAYPEDGIPIMRQALEGNFFHQFVLSDGMKSDSIIDALGDDALEGTIGTVPHSPVDSPSYRRWLELYEDAHGYPPADPFMDSVYDATFIMGLAIAKAGPRASGLQVRDAIRQVSSPPGETILPGEWRKAMDLLNAGKEIDYTGAAGSHDFDEYGDVPGTYGLWRITEGQIVIDEIVSP